MEQWTQTSLKSGLTGDMKDNISQTSHSSNGGGGKITHNAIVYNHILDPKGQGPASISSPSTHNIPYGNEANNSKNLDTNVSLNMVCNGRRKGQDNPNTTNGHNKRSGFRGRPAIRPAHTPRGANTNKTLPVGGSSGIITPHIPNPHIMSPRLKGGTDIKFQLSGDAVSGGMAGQGRGQGYFNAASRSSTKMPSGEASLQSKLFTSPSPTALAHGRHCEACAIEYIKHWSKQQSIAAKVQERRNGTKDTAETQSVKSDPEAHFFYEPMQLLSKEGKYQKNHIFSLMKDVKASKDYKLKREPAILHTVSVPKKGVIKLTGLTYELDNPLYYDTRKERAAQLEQQRYQEEVFGSTLPAPSGDPHRGWLIKDKSMIKQVRDGEKRLLEEQEEQMKRELTNSAMLNTFIGGLLEYQMPEVPTLNSNLQKFVGVDVDHTSSATHLRGQKGKNHNASFNNTSPALQPYHDESWTPRSLPENHNDLLSTPIPSPRMAFMMNTLENQHEDLTEIGKLKSEKSQTQRCDNNDEDMTLHQVLTKAQQINLSRIQDKHRSNPFDFQLLDSH